MASILTRAQNNASLEKSIYSFQIGIVGIWGQNEIKLTDVIALRTQIGLETDIMYKVGFCYSARNNFRTTMVLQY